MFLDAPRGFRDKARIAERMAMLETEPRVQPLRDDAEDLSRRRGAVVPYFDPAEAGVEARVLFVFEAPGPMTNAERADNRRPGSGFISIDNDDPSAAKCWTARDKAGLPNGPDVSGVLHWNIVPWYLGPARVHPTADEVRQGAGEMLRLLALLPELRAVVLFGGHAQRGWLQHVAAHTSRDYAAVGTWHASARVLNSSVRREEFDATFEWAKRFV
jgi:hypothetical protein